MTTRRSLSLVACCVLAATGCSASGDDEPDARAASSASSSPPTSTASSPPPPSATSSSAPAPSPAEPPNPVSIQALIEKKYDGRALNPGRVLARTSAYTRYFVTYRSGRLRISGVMNVPTGRGPFPVLILGHGYIDPDIYRNGQGLMREQDYLAREGYIVLHTDYRNHAASDNDPNSAVNLRLGYTEDVINAVLAVKRSPLPYLDGERVGLLGRSMGGGITYNALVAQPGLVDAAVVFASVSSNAVDNFNQFTNDDPGDSEEASQIIEKHGPPDRGAPFWRNVSPRTFFDRITEPLLIHHGTADDTCPIRWSRATLAALERNGKDARMLVYQNEGHAFGPQWPQSMRNTVRFLDRQLRA